MLSKLKKALGLDKLKIAISGGGALAVSDIEFFLGLDIRVLEGFGITECSPCTNCNKPELIKPGTCGPADLYTEEKIAEDGELLIRGPQVMLGYFTGLWLRTGRPELEKTNGRQHSLNDTHDRTAVVIFDSHKSTGPVRNVIRPCC